MDLSINRTSQRPKCCEKVDKTEIAPLSIVGAYV